MFSFRPSSSLMVSGAYIVSLIVGGYFTHYRHGFTPFHFFMFIVSGRVFFFNESDTSVIFVVTESVRYLLHC